MSNWTPNSYLSKGIELGYSNPYLDSLLEAGRQLKQNGVPVLFSLGHLAAITDVPLLFLKSIVSRANDPYRTFSVKKRGGGYRQIAVPELMLLRVQRWIHQNILLSRPSHAASTAYATGSSPINNARNHCESKWLVKIDVERFFESVSERQIYYVFREMGYRPLLAFELARLCTRLTGRNSANRSKRWKSDKTYSILDYHVNHLGHLPQGAPTSPILANLVCKPLDGLLAELSQRQGCTFTRYADDIAFSAIKLDRNKARDLIRETSKILERFGFRRKVQKTHIVPPGARKIVTGLVVNGPKPKLTREFKDNLRLHLYHSEDKGLHKHCLKRKFRSIIGFREHLKGLITYAEQVDPEFGSECRAKFNALPWEILG